jgi:hypothetical protein
MKTEKISFEGPGWFFSVFREDDPRIGQALRQVTAVTITQSMTLEEFQAWQQSRATAIWAEERRSQQAKLDQEETNRVRCEAGEPLPVSTCKGGLKDPPGTWFVPPGYDI